MEETNANTVTGIAGALTAGGIITMALFPFLLPGILITLPFVLPLALLALPVVPVVLVALAIRAIRRRRARPSAEPARAPTAARPARPGIPSRARG